MIGYRLLGGLKDCPVHLTALYKLIFIKTAPDREMEGVTKFIPEDLTNEMQDRVPDYSPERIYKTVTFFLQQITF